MKEGKIMRELGKEIRKELKENGYNRTDISVRVSPCGYSTSVRIEVKNLSIPIEKIEKIVSPFSSVEYDEVTRECLQGGNTYIDVTYNYEILEAETEKLIPFASKIWEGLQKTREHSISTIAENADYSIQALPSTKTSGSGFIKIVSKLNDGSLFHAKYMQTCSHPNEIAEFFAIVFKQYEEIEILNIEI